MNTRKNKKEGFTLVELMVVAIIVAILAAVAIPLMTGNTERAMSTEAQAGCSTVATAIKVYVAENGTTTAPTIATLPGIADGDLSGTYFSSYAIGTGFSDAQNFTVTATGKSGSKAEGKSLTMTVSGGATSWSELTDIE